MAIPRFILVDMDDTILDYDATGLACWRHFYEEYAPRLQVGVADLRCAVEESRRWFWGDMRRYRMGRLNQTQARRGIMHRAFRALGIRRPDLADEFAERFTREREEWIQPFPGALPALVALRAAGARLAMVTNGQASQQRAKIERFQLAQYFDLIWIEGERGVGKPDAEVFTRAAQGLGARVEEAWMVGDDVRFDIRPAHDLGMRTAWIDIGRDRMVDVPCDMRVSTLWELSERWARPMDRRAEEEGRV
jgi:putative hydrolase of the HAD superfamily